MRPLRLTTSGSIGRAAEDDDRRSIMEQPISLEKISGTGVGVGKTNGRCGTALRGTCVHGCVT